MTYERIGQAIDVELLDRHWLPDEPFKVQLLHIMRQAREGCSYARTEQSRFEVAVAVALKKTIDPLDRTWLEQQVHALKNLAALMGGVDVDVERMAQQAETIENRGYSLMSLWRESRGEPL